MRFSTIAAAATVASSASAVSICDKYTTALLTNNTAANQYALVTLLVKTTGLGNFTGPGTANPTLPGSMVDVPGILAPGMYAGQSVMLKPYFDGSLLSTNVNGMPGSVNWLDGGAPTDPLSFGSAGSNQLTLLSHLTQYFGVLLGCSMYGMDGFPTYAGSNNQYDVHKYMDLSEAEFSYFIVQVGLAAQSFGASQTDIMAVATSLNTTFGYRCAPPAMVVPGTPVYPQVMCGDASCPLSPNATCSGAAAYGSYTETDPATTTTAPFATSNGMTIAATATGAMTTSTGLGAFSGAAAPRQTAAAGLLAAVGIAAALL